MAELGLLLRAFPSFFLFKNPVLTVTKLENKAHNTYQVCVSAETGAVRLMLMSPA